MIEEVRIDTVKPICDCWSTRVRGSVEGELDIEESKKCKINKF